MARTQVVTYDFSCDVCGNHIPDADQPNAATELTLGRATYQVDLCKKDKSSFEKAVDVVQSYLDAGRKVAGRSAGTSPTRRRSTSTGRRRGSARRGGDVSAIREWARKNGYEVSTRGRIAQALHEAYLEANR